MDNVPFFYPVFLNESVPNVNLPGVALAERALLSLTQAMAPVSTCLRLLITGGVPGVVCLC